MASYRQKRAIACCGLRLRVSATKASTTRRVALATAYVHFALRLSAGACSILCGGVMALARKAAEIGRISSVITAASLSLAAWPSAAGKSEMCLASRQIDICSVTIIGISENRASSFSRSKKTVRDGGAIMLAASYKVIERLLSEICGARDRAIATWRIAASMAGVAAAMVSLRKISGIIASKWRAARRGAKSALSRNEGILTAMAWHRDKEATISAAA